MIFTVFTIFFIVIGGACASDINDNVSNNVYSENGILNSEEMNVANYSANTVDVGSSVSDLNSVSDVNSDSKTVSSSNLALDSKFDSKVASNNVASINEVSNNIASNNSDVVSAVSSEDNQSQNELVSDNSFINNSTSLANSEINSYALTLDSVSQIKENCSFIVDNFSSVNGSGENFTVTLVDANNNPLVGIEVELVLKNLLNQTKSYWRTTNTNGVAKLPIFLAYPSYYSITAKYAGSDEYNSPTPATGNLTIYDDSKRVNVVINGSGNSITTGDYYNITLTDVNGKVLANQRITVTFIRGGNSKSYGYTTDSKGRIYVPIGLDPATWGLNVTYAGSVDYRPGSFYTDLIVSANGESVSNVTGSVSIKNIGSAAAAIKTYAETHEGQLPESVTIDGKVYTLAQFLYMMSAALTNINNGVSSNINVGIVNNPTSSTGDKIQDKLNKTDYLKLANTLMSYMASNNVAPVNASSAIGTIQFNTLVYTYAKVMAYYSNNNALPNYSFTFDITNDYYITIIAKPSTANSGYEYKWYNTTFVNYCPVCGIYGCLQDNPKGVAEGELTCCLCDADFDGVTGTDKGNTTYVLTKVGNSVLVNSTTNSTTNNTNSSTTVTVKDIITAASIIKNYVDANKTLPTYVSVGGVKYTMAQFSYMMTQAIANIYKGSSANVVVIDIKDPSNPSGDSLDETIYTANYTTLCANILAFIAANGQMPNYASYGSSKISYELYSYAFAKILIFYGNNAGLPNYCTFQSSVFVNNTVSNGTAGNISYAYTANSSQYKKGLNEVNTVTDLSTYLSCTGHNAANSAIRSLATQLTSGLTSTWDKAAAIFNYVRDSISYSYYANSKYDATGTLTYKKGNCCDQANLIVALCRSAGIPARYSHGQGCKFSTMTAGHVWAQILVGDTWYTADATSSRNSLGNIKNWNTNSFTLSGIYTNIGF